VECLRLSWLQLLASSSSPPAAGSVSCQLSPSPVLSEIRFQVLLVWNTRTQSSGASSCVVYMYLLPFQVEGCAVF